MKMKRKQMIGETLTEEIQKPKFFDVESGIEHFRKLNPQFFNQNFHQKRFSSSTKSLENELIFENNKFDSTLIKAENNFFSQLFHFNTTDDAKWRKTLFYLPDGKTISYGEFYFMIQKYFHFLESKLKKGDRLAAQISKTPESIALYLATLKLGGVYIPLNTDYKKDEIRYFLLNSEPTIFVCRKTDFELYTELMKTKIQNSSSCLLIDEENLKSQLFDGDADEIDFSSFDFNSTTEIEKMRVDDLASILYTSGTTGQPKGAMITHGNLISNSRSLCDLWKINETDILLHAMPTYHVHGLFVAMNTILSKNASLVFLPKFDLDTVLKWLPKCTLMMGVPTFYTRLFNSDKFGRDFTGNIRLFVSGSAPLLESTWKEFKERTGHEILERYGMTEGQMICSNPYDGTRKCGTVGKPLPNVSVRIRNSKLEYKGPNLFKGYWRMPEKTKEEFTDDGYFMSGDLAELDSDGYVKIMGRGKDLIISGGLNVYPKEIENAIDCLNGVLESAVIGVPHSDFGEAVVAVVVSQENFENENLKKANEDEMIKILKDRIAHFKVPKRIFFQNQLPRNIMGKVQKNILREHFKDTFSK